jgi:hypothetical protein
VCHCPWPAKSASPLSTSKWLLVTPKSGIILQTLKEGAKTL